MENYTYKVCKLIFSLISLFLMLVPLLNGDSGFYKTLFVFLINRVLDLLSKERIAAYFFRIWALINQWMGVIVCALAFCSMIPEFAKILMIPGKWVSGVMFAVAASCVVQEGGYLMAASIKETLIVKDIEADYVKRRK